MDWLHFPRCGDPSVFTPEEVDRIVSRDEEVNATDQLCKNCVRCDDAGVQSKYTYVCNEGIARKLQRLSESPGSFQDITDVQYLRDIDGNPSLFIRVRLETRVDDLLRLALAVLSKLSQDVATISRVDIYPCNDKLVRDYWKFRIAPDTLQRAAKKCLEEHTFFSFIVNYQIMA
jgi:hypothetical protein